MVDVAQPERARYPWSGRWLVDDWHDCPCDQVPVLVQSDRNHRLNVQDPLCGVVRADAKIKVILEGYTDEIGDRILGFLCQFLGFRLLITIKLSGVSAE